MIQASEDTARRLTEAGKGHWLTPRNDAVNAKGKGVLQTYWLNVGACRKASNSLNGSSHHTKEMVDADVPISAANEKNIKRERLASWMAELLEAYLKPILAKRRSVRASKSVAFEGLDEKEEASSELIGINEVVDAIALPLFDANLVVTESNIEAIEIDPVVVEQIREFVSVISLLYRENPFHNFEHACHVTMSVSKHLKRIVAPDLDVNDGECLDKAAALALLHDCTHGINSDPMTHFAIIFSGLIHDVDHRGISNAQLEKEEPALAEHFKHQCLAEQNSLEIAWTLLLSDSFHELRQCLFGNSREEQSRFRQVVVNVVMATDIFDKELSALRKNRWERAFSDTNKDDKMAAAQSAEDTTTDHQQQHHALRATIVLEHIIQASDVSHTMQHWHVYRKWNRRLFREMTLAFRAGRMAVDPATFWYQGEIGFFDGYVIPLAKKLKDCKVFGVNSDECLNYALRNRAEWEVRGEEVLAEMMQELADYEPPSSQDGGELLYL